LCGKVVSERLLEKDEAIKKLSGESKKLKHELNKAQASGVELEQWISELVGSLKKCKDEKRLVEAALRVSKKDLQKLNKTHEDDRKSSQGL
jgi:SMC interacting uncharacterized protein involved in chromosome segregation